MDKEGERSTKKGNNDYGKKVVKEAKIILLPGFEPGMLDSKSRVITTSLQENQV
jgi:hypothetical protein